MEVIKKIYPEYEVNYIWKLLDKINIKKETIGISTLITMLNYPFDVIVEKDQNRVEDALRLREEDELPEKISVLEVIIALAIRLDNDYIDNGPDKIFKEMLKNLGINEDIQNEEINKICKRLVERDYRANGYGGLFPLSHATNPEQWKVDLWGQAMAYIQENKERLIN